MTEKMTFLLDCSLAKKLNSDAMWKRRDFIIQISYNFTAGRLEIESLAIFIDSFQGDLKLSLAFKIEMMFVQFERLDINRDDEKKRTVNASCILS